MAFWRHYFHLVWATKDRLPLITPALEDELYGYITGKVTSLRCLTHAIGGVDNHLHLVVSVPPKLAVADFVGKIKGSSSHHVEHHLLQLQEAFGWQRGYGSLTFGKKQLDFVVQYVLNQKHHHQAGTIILGMERDDEEEDGPETAYYTPADASGIIRETDAFGEYII